MTRILGEYTTLAGDPRRLVAVERSGPSGWCLLDIPTRADAAADDFQIVRRLGDPSMFRGIAERWIARAVYSPLADNWIASEAERGALTIRSTVDIYNDRRGMRRLVVVEEPEGSATSHLVDVAVDQVGTPQLVAPDVADVGCARDFAVVHVERVLLRGAACRARCHR